MALFSRTVAVAALAGAMIAVFSASAPAGSGASKVVKVRGTQTVVDEKKGLYEMHGSLVGKWNVTAFTEHYASDIEYAGSGRERFQGCLDANRNGACETGEPAGSIKFTFIYWASFDGKGSLVKGQCVHPVVGGTGAFAKAKGLIQVKDVPTKSGVRTTYAGTLEYPGGPRALASHAATSARSLATSSRCGSTAIPNAASSTSLQVANQTPESYYLALGDSIAYGVQPTRPGAQPSAVAGYVYPFAARLRKLSPNIQVVNYGCPGESTVTFTKGGCPWLAEGRKLHDPFRGSQLEAALSFLRAHPGEVSPITLTLWGNDVFPLSQKGKRAPRAIASVASRLKSILRQLRAAEPTAEIIVTGAWNPEVPALGQAEPLYRSLDAAIARAAAASRVRVADMFATFNGHGNVRSQKARLCALTFICKGDPHPTDAGYRAMAEAFMAASGYPRKP